MVCQPPCFFAVGPRPFPCDLVRRCVTRSGKSSNILPFPPFFLVPLAASCAVFPSDQASVASIAFVGPLLGDASESGVAARIRFFCSAVFCGTLGHSAWGEGTLRAFCLHMWLPPLCVGPTPNNKKILRRGTRSAIEKPTQDR